MPDREKISTNYLLKEIKRTIDESDSTAAFCLCQRWILKDALALLKEREAVMPKISSVEQRCGNCNKVIEMDGWIACPWCGKPILWKGR